MAITLFFLCLLPCAFSQLAQRCQDRMSTNHCVYWKRIQYCRSSNRYHQFMRRYCPKTCGFCQVPATTIPPVTTVRPRTKPPVTVQATPAQRCKDISSTDACLYWKGLQYCKKTHVYYHFMTKNCSKTCGFCQRPATTLAPRTKPPVTTQPTTASTIPPVTTVRPRTNPPVTVQPTPAPRCKDISSTDACLYWKGLQYCKKTHVYYGFMKKNCSKTCGFCQRPASTIPPVTTVRHRTNPPVTAQPTPAQRCKDLSTTDDCLYYKGLQYCKKTHIYYHFMTKNCSKTCGFCQRPATTLAPRTKPPVTTQPTPATTTPPVPTVRPRTNPPVTVQPTPAQRCKDLSTTDDCLYYKGLQYCKKTHKYYHFMTKNCSKTCGFCQRPATTLAPRTKPPVTTQPTPATTTPPVPTFRPRTNPPVTVQPTPAPRCKDISSADACLYWKGLQYCKKTHVYYHFMKKNCSKTCGFCPGQATTLAPRTNPPVKTQPRPATTLAPRTNPPVTAQPKPGKPELTCGFETDFCQWVNEPSNDNADWAIGIARRGPSSGAGGSSQYAYIDKVFSNSRARLVLPLRTALPRGVTNKGTMCMKFKFQTGPGTLKVMEQMYPTSTERYPAARTIMNLQGGGSWVGASVQVTVDNKRKIIIEGKTGFAVRVVVDNIEFVSGRCSFPGGR